MARLTVKVNWDNTAFTVKLPRMSDEAVGRAAKITADRAIRQIRAAGRWGTGHMAQQTRAERVSSGVWNVGSFVPYAMYQHEGTRDHGPRTAKVLRFKPKGSRTFVFAKRVRGIKGSHFLTEAVAQLKTSDFG